MGDHPVLNAHPGHVLRRSERIQRLNDENNIVVLFVVFFMNNT
jgi:hypothetical protein